MTQTQNGPNRGWPREFHIGDKPIGIGHPVYVIAEAGVNHNGRLDLAKGLIDAACAARADAVKFQTFKAENLNTRSAPKATYHVETTGTDEEQSWFDLLKTQELTAEMHQELIDYCDAKGIQFLSTPYDEESLDFLDSLDVPAIKVASTDLNNHPFLSQIAAKGKPVLLSTAMSTLEEVRDSVEVLKRSGCQALVVLHCTGDYPARLSDTNMWAVVTIREELDVLVGYSDHTVENVNPVLAVAMGAVVFEKHFTLDKTLPGPDHRMALTPEELKRTVSLIRQAESALGSRVKQVLPNERETRARLRKSLVAARDLPPGTVLDSTCVAIKRPGTGLPPACLYQVLGRKVCRPLLADTLLSWEDLE
jgi:N,N'-diacetyllegionaminate synthase